MWGLPELQKLLVLLKLKTSLNTVQNKTQGDEHQANPTNQAFTTLFVPHLQKWQQNPIPRQDHHQIFTHTVDEGDCLQTFLKLAVPRRKGATLWHTQLAISQTSLLTESFSFLHSQFRSVQLSWKAATLVKAWKKLSALYLYWFFSNVHQLHI